MGSAVLLGTWLAFGGAAHGAVSFQFDFGADNDLGFWDPTLGLDRQAALATAAIGFSSMFGSYFSNSGVVQIDAVGGGTSALASFESTFFGSGTPGFTVADVVKTKAFAGSMMLHRSLSGQTLARNYSPIEVGMLRDLGYAVNAVPEPATVLLLLAGLLVVSAAARRPA